MVSHEGIPDLTFHSVRYSKSETHWDLRPLLHRGGAGAKKRQADRLVVGGAFGPPLLARLPLLVKLHDTIQSGLVSGKSRIAAGVLIRRLRNFYSWADNRGYSLTETSVEAHYIEWTDHLLDRQRVMSNLKHRTVYDDACSIGVLLSEALDISPGLIRKTRLKKDRRKHVIIRTRADKQNLNDTFEFGRMLFDITDSLSTKAIHGSLPVRVAFRAGQVIEEWSGMVPLSKLKHENTGSNVKPCYMRYLERSRSARQADTSRRTRYPLINLRIQAELLIFISQTGMNLAQAHKLTIGKFRFRSHLGGYQVLRIYKNRRQGEVEFEIYAEYRVVFERYLDWRREIFQEDEEALFPVSSPQGRSSDIPPTFSAIRKKCHILGVPFFPPRTLRKTRVNWLVRHSQDTSLAAEMSQHSQATLLHHYIRPHHQAAAAEITLFHAAGDVAVSPPGPGTCVGMSPIPIVGAPDESPPPDCVSPAGCLFCSHHRDIDSTDHVWSLATYRHLKSMELAGCRLPLPANVDHPAALVIDRATAKLKMFESSSEVRALWVREAASRVEEGDYHPKWDGFIQLLEA